jgi:hypothetical protein
MPRRPKPFFHRGWWVTNIGGTRTKVAQGRENKDAAEDALLDLLNELRRNPNCETYPQLTVRGLCDKFLDWVELHRAPDTDEDYHDGLTTSGSVIARCCRCGSAFSFAFGTGPNGFRASRLVATHQLQKDTKALR